MSSLGERIKQASERVGGGSALSRMTEINRRTLAAYVGEETEPKASTLLAIAEATGVNPAWLLTGKGDIVETESPYVGPPRTSVNWHMLGDLAERVHRAYQSAGRKVSHRGAAEHAAEFYNRLMHVEGGPDARQAAIEDWERLLRRALAPPSD